MNSTLEGMVRQTLGNPYQVSDIRLAVAIMAHHRRAHLLSQIVEDLYPFTDIHLEGDYKDSGSWATARKCWEAAPEWATHLLILQDDVLLCKDFYGGAVQALSYRAS